MNRFRVTLGLAFLVAGLLGCDAARFGSGGFKATAEVALTAPWEGYERVEIRSRNGSVELLRADVADVEVSGKRYVRGYTQAEADENLTRVEVYAGRHAARSDALLVELRFPDELERRSPGASLTVRVPESCVADVQTSNGGLRVSAMREQVVLRTSNGAIGVSDIDGRVAAHTSNGGVTAEDVEGKLEVDTSNGAVVIEQVVGAVRVDASNGQVRVVGVDGALEVRTTNGSIEVRDAQGGCRLDTSNGHIEAEVRPRRDEAVEAETSNAGIELTLPADLAADLDLDTSNGSITVDVPDGRLSEVKSGKREFRARLNGGGARLRASTSNGSIRVQVR